MAGAPLLLLCLDAALLFGGVAQAAAVGLVLAILANTILAIWDSRYLKGLGYEVSTALAVFLVPVYLLARSRRLGQAQGLLAAWIAAFVISVAGSAALGSHFVTLDMGKVEGVIRDGVDRQANTSSTVSCPSKTVYAVKSTFICDVSDSTGAAHAQVTVQDSSGTFTWQIIG